MRTALFLVFGLLVTVSIALGQSSKYIVNYGPEVNKSGETIYAIASDRDGILYFSIAKGLMVYDGERWEIYSMNGNGDARSVEYDAYRDRVWVGGVGTFGYFKKDPTKRFVYVPLSDSISTTHPFRQVWLINVKEDVVILQSHEGHYRVRGDQVEYVPLLDTYHYSVGDEDYFTKKEGDLIVKRGDDTVLVWDQNAAKKESAFAVYAIPGNQHLIIYPNQGAFVRNLSTNQISVYRPLDDIMRKNTMYCAAQLSDSVFAIGTYSTGIFVTDITGRVGAKFDREGGVASNGFYDLEVDCYGRIWGGTEYGTCLIDVRKAIPQFTYPEHRPSPTLITSVTLNRDSTLYLAAGDTLYYHQKPEVLEFHFAMPGIEYFSDHQYRTKLEGFDSDWTLPRGANSRDFRDLPNGTYVLRAQARTKVASVPEATLVVIIDEPWYVPVLEASIFIVGGLGAFGIILFGYTYRLRHSKRTLTRLVSEKTREIEAREKELISINQSLMQTNEELDTFLYRSSHDLVSPVKSIKGLISLMRLSDGDQQLYVSLMEDRITRLESILQEINLYVRNAKRDSILTTIQVKELVRSVWESLEFLDSSRRIQFRLDVGDGVVIESDREQWRMILNNLISNAVKYHDPHKQPPTIRVKAGFQGDAFFIMVEDNGQGIRREHLQKVFDMFYRANESSDGTGLGLFLVRKMAERLNATLDLKSEFGSGTTVEIRLVGLSSKIKTKNHYS